jgi:hypothetical protein
MCGYAQTAEDGFLISYPNILIARKKLIDMSAYKLIKCSIIDKDLLLQALKSLGFNPEVFDIPQFLRGYANETREEKAEIIVPKEQINKLYTKASNDLGFIWNQELEQYDMIVSEYDLKLNIANKIKQSYAKAVIEKALEDQYFNVESDENEIKSRKINKVTIIGKKYI